MSLNKGELNPLSVLGVRKLSFIPNHFTKLSIGEEINRNMLSHWIEYNLNSRYAIVRKSTLDSNKKIIDVVEVGLEDPREIILLTLGCYLLHKK